CQSVNCKLDHRDPVGADRAIGACLRRHSTEREKLRQHRVVLFCGCCDAGVGIPGESVNCLSAVDVGLPGGGVLLPGSGGACAAAATMATGRSRSDSQLALE